MPRFELWTRTTNFLLNPSFDWAITYPWVYETTPPLTIETTVVPATYWQGFMGKTKNAGVSQQIVTLYQEVTLAYDVINTDFYFYCWGQSSTTNATLQLVLEYLEQAPDATNPSIVGTPVTGDGSIATWNELATSKITTGSSYTQKKIIRAKLKMTIPAGGIIYFDQAWLQKTPTEKYAFEEPPSLPYRDTVLKMEKRERGLTGRMFSQFQASKRRWTLNFFACNRTQKDKFKDYFQNGYRFLLFFEPDDTWKERAEVIWDTDEFGFEVLPGNQYWSGELQLAEV